MKISCLPVSLFKEIQKGNISLKEWARIGREAGLNGIDLSTILIPNHTGKVVTDIIKDFMEEEMPVIMITTYPDFTHPGRMQREREKEYFRRDIALSSALGAKYLRILAGQAHPETDTAEGICWVIESFKEMDEIAQKYNIQLLFENHSKPGVWEYSDFSHPTEIFMEICEKTKDTGIGINFDTCNTLAYGDDPMPVLERIIDRVVTIHVADIKEKGSLKPVLIGTGIVPFDEIFAYLKSKKFNGWFCIEEASSMGIEGIRKAVEYVKSLEQ
jgi:sugar phosphate isomerase/epimerase